MMSHFLIYICAEPKHQTKDHPSIVCRLEIENLMFTTIENVPLFYDWFLPFPFVSLLMEFQVSLRFLTVMGTRGDLSSYMPPCFSLVKKSRVS